MSSKSKTDRSKTDKPMTERSKRDGGKALAATLLSVGTVLGGCSDIYFDRRESIALSAGDAIAVNRVEQMIDPWPRYVGDKNIAFNGERMQGAVERYRLHEVIRPVPLTTSANSLPQTLPPVTTEAISIPRSGSAAPAAAVAGAGK
jgi:hypothetical protein